MGYFNQRPNMAARTAGDPRDRDRINPLRRQVFLALRSGHLRQRYLIRLAINVALQPLTREHSADTWALWNGACGISSPI